MGPAAPNAIRTSNRMTGLVDSFAADLNFSLLARARGAGEPPGWTELWGRQAKDRAIAAAG